jgi:hypothetical protein
MFEMSVMKNQRIFIPNPREALDGRVAGCGFLI